MSDNVQDDLIGKDEMRDTLHAASRSAFKDFDASIKKGESGKTIKLFGLFDMDAPMAGLVTGFYNEGMRRVGAVLAPKTYKLSANLLEKHTGLQGSALARVATASMVTTNLALSGSAFFAPLVQSTRAHREQYLKTARALAPVLEDIRGNHSVGALMSIRQQDNEMIYAHRQRMALKMKVETSNNVINLLVNAGPAIIETPGLKEKWSGKELGLAASTGPAQPEKKNDILEWLLGSFAMGRGSIATYMMSNNERKLEKHRRPYSALDMVLELDKQVAGDPKAHSFTTPGGRGNSYSLEEYIARTMMHHQAEMADISDEHTEIREALTDDLMAASKKIAAAIRKGEISTLSLVRLVGEGHIIKKNGRAIAPIAEVKDAIAHMSGRQATYVHVDPADYYKDAAFSHDQLKTALKSLEGEEKRIFASMFPNEVLEEAGMSACDIKAMREAIAKNYDTLVAEAILGLNEKTDAQLKEMGLANNEVKQLREAVSALQETGLDAIKALKTNAANDHGIEHLLTNTVVQHPQHLGMLIKNGREKFDSIAANDAMPEEEEKLVANSRSHAHPSHKSHAKREESRRHSHEERARD